MSRCRDEVVELHVVQVFHDATVGVWRTDPALNSSQSPVLSQKAADSSLKLQRDRTHKSTSGLCRSRQLYETYKQICWYKGRVRHPALGHDRYKRRCSAYLHTEGVHTVSCSTGIQDSLVSSRAC